MIIILAAADAPTRMGPTTLVITSRPTTARSEAKNSARLSFHSSTASATGRARAFGVMVPNLLAIGRMESGAFIYYLYSTTK